MSNRDDFINYACEVVSTPCNPFLFKISCKIHYFLAHSLWHSSNPSLEKFVFAGEHSTSSRLNEEEVSVHNSADYFSVDFLGVGGDFLDKNLKIVN